MKTNFGRKAREISSEPGGSMNSHFSTATWGPFDYIVVIGVSTMLILGVFAIFRAIKVITRGPQ